MNCKTKNARIVEADESTRKRMEGTLHKGREDHVAGRGINPLNHVFWQDCCGKSNSRKFCWNTVGEKFQIGNAYSLTEKKD